MFGRSKLGRLSIPKPCHEDWDKMAGDARKKFCGSCSKNVHNLSVLTRREAELVVRDAGPSLCARVVYDERGKLMFRAEPQSWISKQFARLAFFGIAALEAQGVASAQSSLSELIALSPKTCRLNVHALDPAGCPVALADISLASEHDYYGKRTGSSDDYGNFQTTMPAGKYMLKIHSPGFHEYEAPVNLSCDKDVDMKIEVQMKLAVTGLTVDVVSTPEIPLVPSIRKRWLKITDPFRKVPK